MMRKIFAVLAVALVLLGGDKAAIVGQSPSGGYNSPSLGGSGGLPPGLTFASPTLTVSSAGNGNGCLALSGNTSGTATLCAPAVAGTSTNGVTGSNVLLLPDGVQANPSYAFASEPNMGMFRFSASQLGFGISGAIRLRFVGAIIETRPDHVFSWNASTNLQGATDTGISRDAAGVIDLGNGTAGNFSAFLRSGNTVRVASNFTTAANTNLQTITGLSWTVPATSTFTFSYSCDLAYSQATAVAAVAFGIQAATNAPTNIFSKGDQQITVGPPSTYAAGVLATLATTTATNIVSGTPGATATNYTVHLGGTIENPATTANTFNIMVSTAASADAVTVLRGSACFFTP